MFIVSTVKSENLLIAYSLFERSNTHSLAFDFREIGSHIGISQKTWMEFIRCAGGKLWNSLGSMCSRDTTDEILFLISIQTQASTQGLTGRIEFTEGRRSNFKIDLLKLKRERVEKVGYWSPEAGVNVTDSTAFYETSATNITLIVMTREVSAPNSKFPARMLFCNYEHQSENDVRCRTRIAYTPARQIHKFADKK